MTTWVTRLHGHNADWVCHRDLLSMRAFGLTRICPEPRIRITRAHLERVLERKRRKQMSDQDVVDWATMLVINDAAACIWTPSPTITAAGQAQDWPATKLWVRMYMEQDASNTAVWNSLPLRVGLRAASLVSTCAACGSRDESYSWPLSCSTTCGASVLRVGPDER